MFHGEKFEMEDVSMKWEGLRDFSVRIKRPENSVTYIPTHILLVIFFKKKGKKPWKQPNTSINNLNLHNKYQLQLCKGNIIELRSIS